MAGAAGPARRSERAKGARLSEADVTSSEAEVVTPTAADAPPDPTPGPVGTPAPTGAPGPRLRVDKWLWHARITKTRSLAQTLVKTGKVRVNAAKVAQPSRVVGAGDVLTVLKDRRVLVLKIVAVGERRGPAPEARALYEDMSPPPPPRTERPPRPLPQAVRDDGAGRPTKRERRQMERLRGED